MGPRAPGTSNACGAASAIRAVVDGGPLATITPDPPSQQRGITVSSIYVRADGNQLRKIPIAASYRLADVAASCLGGVGGAIVLTP